jgi:hypothetical protein
MRFYLKLFVLVAIFACASRWPLRHTISDLAYDARVGFVCAFGSASDYEALIEDAQRRDNLDLYLKGQRYRQLLAERLAAAARLNMPLSEDDLERIRTQCVMEAFGRGEDLRGPAPNSEKQPTVGGAREHDGSRRSWCRAPAK